jgi:CHAD domain-containing protein
MVTDCMDTVSDVILSNLQSFHATLPSVREGDSAAIHDARVATRRLRAALPFLGIARSSDSAAEPRSMLKTIGRALGKARDQDEALRLLGEIEARAPATAPAAAVLRARLRPEQLRQRRRLIKTLEASELDSLDQLRDLLDRESRRSRHSWARRSGLQRVAAVIGGCAETLEEKMQHAAGVYFPNRAHKVRIAIKKLRYAVELIDKTEGVRKPSIRALRTAQAVLGRVHDREMLLRRLTSVATDEDVPAARTLAGVLEAETRSLFEEYRAMRPDVLAACADLGAWARRHGPHSRPRLLLVGAVALPSAAVLLATRARRAG